MRRLSLYDPQNETLIRSLKVIIMNRNVFPFLLFFWLTWFKLITFVVSSISNSKALTFPDYWPMGLSYPKHQPISWLALKQKSAVSCGMMIGNDCNGGIPIFWSQICNFFPENLTALSLLGLCQWIRDIRIKRLFFLRIRDDPVLSLHCYYSTSFFRIQKKTL